MYCCYLELYIYIYKYKYKKNSEQLLRLLSMSLHTRDAVSVKNLPSFNDFLLCLKSLFLQLAKLFLSFHTVHDKVPCFPCLGKEKSPFSLNQK